MKKKFSFKNLLVMLCMILMGGGSVMADEISIDFENEVTFYTDWTFTNMTSQQTGSITAHSGTYYGTTGGKETASIATKSKINQPTQITFYVSKQSKNTTESYWKIQVSSDNKTWDDVKTESAISASSMNKGTWIKVTQDLSAYSDVYIRVYYTGTTAVRNIDDLVLTYTAAVVDPQKPEAPNFSLDAGTYYIKSGESKQVELTTDVDGYIYYTTDGQDPITAGTEYTSALTLTSTTTVKACVKKGEYYSNVVSCTYTILPSIANTKETAYITTDAITLIDNKSAEQLADENEKVYVKGKVSKVESFYSSSNSITYWLDNNAFKVYSGKGLNGANFDALSDVTLGADVIIYGNLMKYGSSTYELDEDNYLVSYKASTATLQSVTIERGPSVKTNYLEGESFDKAGLVVYANFSDGSKYDVTGNVDWNITPSSTLSVGTTQISVYATYQGVQSTTHQINVTVSPTTTIDLSTVNQVTTATTDKLEWTAKESEVPVFVVTVDKGESSTNANSYYPGTPEQNYDHTRFYKDSKLTFTPSATVRLEKIVFTSTENDYAKVLANSTWTNATAYASGSTVTIHPQDGMLPVSAKIGKVTRCTKIVVGYTDLTEFHTRTTATGSYGTVCLPRDAKVVGAKIYDVTDANVNTVSITEVNGNVLKGGKPYVYKATADAQRFYFASGDDQMVVGTNGVLVGSYTEKDVTANAGNYILSGNMFHLVNSDNVKVGANRAYIHIGSPSGARLLIAEGDTETGICLPMVDAEEKDASTGVYDLSGRRVVNAKSGVYVQNGKLVIK